MRIIEMMPRRIPAPDREVDAAREREGIIDDDDFLVMRRAPRQDIVEAKSNLIRRLPAEL